MSNIANSLYGRPFFLNSNDGKDNVAKHMSVNNKGFLMYDMQEGKVSFNSVQTAINTRIEDLTKEQEKTKAELQQIIDETKRVTVEAFGSEDEVENFIKKMNNLTNKDIEKKIYDLSTTLVNEALAMNNNKGGSLSFDAKKKKDFFKREKVSLEIQNTIDVLREALKITKDEDITLLEKTLKNKIAKSLLNKNAPIDIVSDRKRGAIGELAEIFEFGYATVTKEGVENFINQLNNVNPTGKTKKGVRPKTDLTFKISEKVIGVSIKNYESLKSTNMEGNPFNIEIHGGSKINFLLEKIKDKIDPGLVIDKELLQNFNNYWVNMAYLYNYDENKSFDQEIRNNILKLFQCYGFTLLIGGTSSLRKNKKGKTYYDLAEQLLKSSRSALFLKFSQRGIIPMYKVLEAIYDGINSIDPSNIGTKITLKYSTSKAVSDVDNRDEQGRYISSKGGEDIAPGDFSKIENLLSNRYKTFTKTISPTNFSLTITRNALKDLLG